MRGRAFRRTRTSTATAPARARGVARRACRPPGGPDRNRPRARIAAHALAGRIQRTTPSAATGRPCTTRRRGQIDPRHRNLRRRHAVDRNDHTIRPRIAADRPRRKRSLSSPANECRSAWMLLALARGKNHRTPLCPGDAAGNRGGLSCGDSSPLFRAIAFAGPAKPRRRPAFSFAPKAAINRRTPKGACSRPGGVGRRRDPAAAHARLTVSPAPPRANAEGVYAETGPGRQATPRVMPCRNPPPVARVVEPPRRRPPLPEQFGFPFDSIAGC